MDAGTILDAGIQLAFPEVAVVAEPMQGVGPGFFNIDNVLAYQNAVLIVAAWSITEMLSRATRKMGNADIRASILTLLPLGLCVAFVLGTAHWQPTATTGERVLLGCLLGTFTVWGHTVAKSTGLHDKLPILKLVMGEKAVGAEAEDEKKP